MTATVHMSEDEVIGNFSAVLKKVQDGMEVVIEKQEQPVAVMRAPTVEGRLLSECIAIAEARMSNATLDDGFMEGVEEGIRLRSKTWNPHFGTNC